MIDRFMLAAASTAFVWQEHTREIVTAALLSMVPTFEGRYAVAVAVRMGMPAVFSFLLALYIFVALPLPGTGVWTGSAVAALFRMPRGKATAAILLGNVTACLIMVLMAVGSKAII